jgi:hypothetical protein
MDVLEARESNDRPLFAWIVAVAPSFRTLRAIGRIGESRR